MGWFILIIIVVVILIIWWALLRNTKNTPDFPVHHEEMHAEYGDEAQSVTRAAVDEEAALSAMEDATFDTSPAVMLEPELIEEAPAEIEAAEFGRGAVMPGDAPLAPTDDLTIVEGIGPRVNELLHANGINNFTDLAAATEDQLRLLLAPAGYQYMNPASWPEQARLANEGRMDELKVLQDSLKGGRA